MLLVSSCDNSDGIKTNVQDLPSPSSAFIIFVNTVTVNKDAGTPYLHAVTQSTAQIHYACPLHVLADVVLNFRCTHRL